MSMNAKKIFFLIIVTAIYVIFSTPVYATDFYLDLKKCNLNGIDLNKFVDFYVNNLKEETKMKDYVIDLFSTSIPKMQNYHSSRYNGDLYIDLRKNFGFTIASARLIEAMQKKYNRGVILIFDFKLDTLKLKSNPLITSGTKMKYLETILGKPNSISKFTYEGDKYTEYFYNICDVSIAFTFDDYGDLWRMTIASKYRDIS